MTQLLHLYAPPKSDGDYRFAWIVAAGLSIFCAPLVVLFEKQAPLLIAVPIVLGALLIATYELKAEGFIGQSRAHDVLVTLPAGFEGLRAYNDLLALTVRPRPKVPKNQLSLFPGFEEPTPGNSVQVLLDSKGREIPTVNCERYSAMVLARLAEHLDKGTEKGLAAALARFASMSQRPTDLQLLLQDKTLREIIVNDIRGNVLVEITKASEKVAKDIMKSAGETSSKPAAPVTTSKPTLAV